MCFAQSLCQGVDTLSQDPNNGPYSENDTKKFIQQTKLKVASWNINGMGGTNQTKLRDKHFIQEISQHDIIALSETHCAKNKYVCLPGYYSYQTYINYPGKRAIGGIALLIKKSIKPAVHIVKDADDFLWFKLDGHFFGLERDTYICAMYIPPEKSNYLKTRGDPDILDQIITDVAKYNKEGYVMLMGDINARTANLADYINNDSDNFTDPDGPSYLIDLQLGQRNSQDKTVNQRGRHLIDLCIQSRLRILNGRSLGDTCGYFTCHKKNGSSVVDYCIANEEFLNKILCFKVHLLSANLSDHCLISALLKTNFRTHQECSTNINTASGEFHWNKGDIEKFQSALTHHDIQDKISYLLNQKYTDVDTAVDDLSNILVSAGDLVLRKKSAKPPSSNNKFNKPWFDKSLHFLRKELGEKAKLLCRFPGDPHVRGSYYKKLKVYNKTRKQKKRAYKQEIINKLELMQAEKPSEFWKVLNDLRTEEGHENPATNISLAEWSGYFRNLNQTETKCQKNLNDYEELLANLPESCINNPIRENEIIKAIKKLKNKKAQGPDKIRNEMIKYSQHIFLPCLVKVFNFILQLEVFPKEWAQGYICPIFKTGNPLIKDNYRGITVTSCLGKLFNSIINSRLDTYLESNNIIPETQIAYKTNCRTSDHMFVLKTLIDKTLKKEKNHLYACFVDFRKAFDSLSHDALMYKLASVGIGGKAHKIIKNLYSKSNLRVKLGNYVSTPFPSNIGVRQGDNLSPNLFKIFIHDLPSIIDPECKPPTLVSKNVGCLLFADDAILLSTSKEGLQRSLVKLHKYCSEWGLVVNTNKTKAITFNLAGKLLPFPLVYNGEPIECVQEYKYLGTIFSTSGTFTRSCNDLYHRGLKAFFKLRHHLSQNHVKCSTYLHLFDTMVKPVLLYSSEIWSPCIAKLRKLQMDHANNVEEAFHDLPIEKLHLLLLRTLLGVNSKTTIMALYSETGRYPLYMEALINSCKYLNRMEEGNCSSLLTETLACNREIAGSWFSNLQKVLVNLNVNKPESKVIPIRESIAALRARFAKFWYEKAFVSRRNPTQGKKLRCYQLFKSSIGMEKYLDIVRNPEARKALAKFRVSSHNLCIETGRFINLAVEDRTCNLCPSKEVEDETHFLTSCSAYTQERMSLFRQANEACPNFASLNDSMKLIWLMSSEDEDIIKATATFLVLCFKTRNERLGLKKKLT